MKDELYLYHYPAITKIGVYVSDYYKGTCIFSSMKVVIQAEPFLQNINCI